MRSTGHAAQQKHVYTSVCCLRKPGDGTIGTQLVRRRRRVLLNSRGCCVFRIGIVKASQLHTGTYTQLDPCGRKHGQEELPLGDRLTPLPTASQ